MAAPNRTSILTKAHKVLKKKYSPVAPPPGRGVLESMLYGCALENAPYQQADDAFARLQETYFDWNEVRVTTVSELAEVMRGLPDPKAAATNLKRCLQNMFEAEYSFDLEGLVKENLGKAIKKLQRYGASAFVTSYTTQTALGGHSIPVDSAALNLLLVLGVITEAEAEKKQAPGLERAIPKSKGVEFGSLLHQLAVDFQASPHGTNPRKIIVEIEPAAKERLPKRASPKKKKKAAKATTKKKTAKKAAKATPKKKTTKKKTKAVARKKSTTKRLVRKKPR
mgnify:CR=1 FL=1